MLIKGLIALAFGTLGLGISEFVAMGLLPYWSQDFSITTAESGHAISAYAIGVSIGAFVTLVLRKLKLKTILLLLIVVHILGNVITAFAPTFETLLAARFIAGLPHGAYFGVGSIIAQRLAAKGRGTSAVSIMVAGMTISNIFGVPLGTALANFVSWRAIFYIVVLWGVLVFVSAFLWIKDTGRIKDTGFKGQFVFLKDSAPWVVLGATMFGNAGIFCLHSYISPVLTDMAHLPLESVAAVLVAIGITMVAFNLLSGRIGDRFTPGRVAFAFQILAGFTLVGVSLFGENAIICIVLACITSGCMFAISAPEQVSILRVSPGGLLLGASMIQAAFNLGNALGASVGGIPFTLDLPISAVPAFGAVLVVIGVYFLYLYVFKHEKRFKDPTEAEADQEDMHDGLAQAQGAMDIHEYGMSDEVLARHELARAARHAAEAAASEIYAQAAAAKLAAQKEKELVGKPSLNEPKPPKVHEEPKHPKAPKEHDGPTPPMPPKDHDAPQPPKEYKELDPVAKDEMVDNRISPQEQEVGSKIAKEILASNSQNLSELSPKEVKAMAQSAAEAAVNQVLGDTKISSVKD